MGLSRGTLEWLVLGLGGGSSRVNPLKKKILGSSLDFHWLGEKRFYGLNLGERTLKS